MKAVLLSIRPNWCKLIWSGMKTIEVRKNRPNLKTPFKGIHLLHRCRVLGYGVSKNGTKKNE